MLPGLQYQDCHSVVLTDPAFNAAGVVALLPTLTPAWAQSLLALRNRLTAPLGLARVTMRQFPTLAVAPHQALLGLDDRHLDFRILLSSTPLPDQTAHRLTLRTLIRFHNAWGRAYLTAVLPFHRLILRRLLQDLARRDTAFKAERRCAGM